jgi:hypothetical protein
MYVHRNVIRGEPFIKLLFCAPFMISNHKHYFDHVLFGAALDRQTDRSGWVCFEVSVPTVWPRHFLRFWYPAEDCKDTFVENTQGCGHKRQ